MKSWYVENTRNYQAIIVDEKTGKSIAVIYDKMDAPLLAAAPDLLACLKHCVGFITDEHANTEINKQEVLDLSKSAIKKAEEM